MSAFIVSKEHIDYLVHAALAVNATWRGFSYFHEGTWHKVDHKTADATGRMLWAENVASVSHRYWGAEPDELPGPVGVDRETIAMYTCPPLSQKRFNPVVALKAIDCLDYQSCEHDGWKTSAAFAFCDYLRGALISMLPGYDDAPWEIDADTTIAA